MSGDRRLLLAMWGIVEEWWAQRKCSVASGPSLPCGRNFAAPGPPGGPSWARMAQQGYTASQAAILSLCCLQKRLRGCLPSRGP